MGATPKIFFEKEFEVSIAHIHLTFQNQKNQF
jgi:hypothetical protein